MRLSFLALAGLTGLAAAAPVLDKRTTILPTEDPFYAVPANVASLTPGTIIRHRPPPAPIAAFGVDPIVLQDTHQILYRTTDAFGNATATVLTVLVPANADMSKVVSYQVAEDAASPNCAPSYAFQFDSATGGLLGTMMSQVEILLIEAALHRGWVVVLPDYEGPHAAFLANHLAAHATLDGIRAALASTSFTGIPGSAVVSLWGYSGGSLASMWAATLQPSYAPDLGAHIVGAAVGGIVPNVSTVLASIDNGMLAGLLPSGIQGLTNQYPYIAHVIETHLLPAYRDKFAKVKAQCLVADGLDFLLDNVTAMVDDPAVLTAPGVMAILNDNALLAAAAAPASIPLYVYKSINDEISPVADADKLVDQYCAGGATVEYVRDFASEHGTMAITGAPRALAWLIDRMDGKPAAAGCSTDTTLSSLLDMSTFTVMPDMLVEALVALLGGKIGPTFPG